MFRKGKALVERKSGFPRIRGDVPYGAKLVAEGEMFSPHTRGCSVRKLKYDLTQAVFPAYAGMFLPWAAPVREIMGFPRIRGDVPVTPPPPLSSVMFSPHTRGCSGH